MVARGCLGTRLGVGSKAIDLSHPELADLADREGRTRTARRGTQHERSAVLRQKNALKYWRVKPDFCERESGVANIVAASMRGCACRNRTSCDRGHRPAQLTSHK